MRLKISESNSVPPTLILKQIVANSHEGVLVIDRTANVVYCNQRMQDILGRPSFEIVGNSIRDFMTELDAREWQRQDYEMRLIKKDGSPIWTMVSVIPLYDDKGEWIGTAGECRDINVSGESSAFLAARKEALKQDTINLEKTISKRTQESVPRFIDRKHSQYGICQRRQRSTVRTSQ